MCVCKSEFVLCERVERSLCTSYQSPNYKHKHSIKFWSNTNIAFIYLSTDARVERK